MTIRSFQEAAQTVQKIYNDGQSANDKTLSDGAVGLAEDLGSIAWMQIANESDLQPVIAVLNGKPKIAFLSALNAVICAPNNTDSMIAESLRPCVKKALAEARLAL